jgi:hypothetical protein
MDPGKTPTLLYNLQWLNPDNSHKCSPLQLALEYLVGALGALGRWWWWGVVMVPTSQSLSLSLSLSLSFLQLGFGVF